MVFHRERLSAAGGVGGGAGDGWGFVTGRRNWRRSLE